MSFRALRGRQRAPLRALCCSLLSTTFVAACGDAAPSASYAMRDSAGVTIVEHVALDSATISRFVLDREPLVRIGVQDGEEAYQFSRIEDAILRADGSVAVLDRGAGTLRVFDSLGDLRWSTGRSGDGPGEFRAPIRIESVRGESPVLDTLIVWDVALGRFSLFVEPNGLVRTVRASELAGRARLLGILRDASAVMERRATERLVDQGRQAVATTSEILRSDTSRAQFSTLGRFAQVMQYQEFNDPDGAFSPAIFSGVVRFSATADGFWSGDPDQTELRRWVDGALQRIVRWRGPDRTVRNADVEALGTVWNANASTPRNQELYRRFIETHPRAERFPAFDELLADSAGNVWMQDAVLEHLDDGVRRWTLLSSDGTSFRARLEHSATLRLLRVTGDQVLAVERDELDVERLVVFRMSERDPE